MRITFGMIAMRRGPHWQLVAVPAEATPFGEPLDEAALLAEAIAGVMKHVPLPTRELGIVSDLTTAAIAFYAVLSPRLAADQHFRAELAKARAGARPMGPATEGPAANGDVAAMLEGLDTAPLRARVEHDVAPDRVQTGDAYEDGVLGAARSVHELPPNVDPEPVLFETVRPGETPARVQDLASPDGEPLLDRLAPTIEVDGEPAARELDV